MLRRTILLAFVAASAAALAEDGYRKPSQAILDVLHMLPEPQVSISPTRDYMLLAQGVNHPPIAEVARPMLRLAGLRIDPARNARRPTSTYFVSLTLKGIDNGTERKVNLPADARISMPEWSPDGSQFAFTNAAAATIELWAGNVRTGDVRRLAQGVNTTYGDALRWMPDSRTLLVLTAPSGRGKPPEDGGVPVGPNIQESVGKTAPVRTYQDLLSSPHDEKLFEYYVTSQLALIDAASGSSSVVGRPAIFATAVPSPDARYLLIARILRPYSWLHPVMAFPREVEIWDRGGQLVKTIARLPLSEPPIDGVRTGPRELEWKPAEPSTLAWAEALDGGDPRRKVPHRDRIVKLAAPFAGEPIEIAKVEHRLRSIQWLERDGGPLVTEFDRTRRWTRTLLLAEGAEPRVLWSRNQSDRYKDPGTLVQRTLPSGHRAVLQSGDSVFLTGLGASPEGDRPFLDRLDLKTLKTERVFRSAADKYESVVGLASANGSRFLVRHESPTEPPNFSLQSPSGRAALTRFTDRAPQLHRIQKQLVRYERSDGVALSFTLYLPPDYKPGTRLPAVVWAYPREFTDPETAGQVSGSTRRFTRFTGPSHLYLLLAGYAVLDNAAMPVVGDPQTVNNTYIEQIVMNAKAAIDKASDMGVIDRDRAGVGGHSYGAFMTANLLAHSDLFRAGIARSGAHNRTLTPFGFQSERRTLWEAPELYIKMSPLMVANKINEPLLMIHGEADNNSGTFPIQSERMYQAVRGNGGTARLVMLPHEAHGYAARESIEHVLAEMIEWCDRWVKVGRAGGATSGR